MVAYAWNPSTWEVNARSGIQATLGFIRPCLKTNKETIEKPRKSCRSGCYLLKATVSKVGP